jgi:5-formyltetrahydrofolate cyclo-ligase
MPRQAPLPFTPDKAALRRQLRAIRKAVPDKTRRHAGQALVRFALRRRLLAANKRIGFYMPANGEIDVMPLLNRAYAMGVQCFLPIVPGRGQLKMWFSRLEHQPHLPRHWRVNRFGIPEYHAPCGQRLRVSKLQRVFMPMLGFDARGYRIGMGGGYYDASLSFRAFRKAWRAPTLIGVAFSAQQAERIPNDPWDVPLDGVLTEQGLIRPRPPSQI